MKSLLKIALDLMYLKGNLSSYGAAQRLAESLQNASRRLPIMIVLRTDAGVSIRAAGWYPYEYPAAGRR